MTLAGFFVELLALSGKAALVAAVVVCIHRVAGRWLPASFRLALWALVAIRLVVPDLPESPVSVVMAAHPETTLPGLAEWLPQAEPGAVPKLEAETRFDLWLAAAVAWLGGMLFLLARRLGAYAQLYRWVRSAEPITSGPVAHLTASCSRQLGLERGVRVLESSAVPGPATFGLLRPVVLLPEGFTERHDEEAQRHMLFHELAHISRFDPLWLLLSQVLVAVHWFNPVLWWAQRQFHVDVESACDATVLQRLQASERPRYGRTLLNVGTHAPVAALSPAFAVSSKQQLTRRIVMITRFKSGSPLRRLTLLGLALGLVAVTLTEIPSAFADSESMQRAEGALLAQRVGMTFASPEGTPMSRAQDIADQIEDSGLPATIVADALRAEGNRLEKAGQAKTAVELRHLAGIVLKEAAEPDSYKSSELKMTVMTIRNAGTMMYSRVAIPNFGERPASEAANIDRTFEWTDCPTASYAEVQEAVGVDMQLPREDGWGRALQYCLDVDVKQPRLRIGVRSAGSDGQFADQYEIGGFPKAEGEQDVVWINGYFVRWPES
ncbi:MAG: M56 family metallopeptidase [Acidobacteriota bacterium]